MRDMNTTAVILLEAHVLNKTSAEHEKQTTARDDCASYAYTRQSSTLRPDSGSRCHTTVGHTAPPCRNDTAGISACSIPYTLEIATLPCASAMTLVQVRTSTSNSFGEKTASTCHVITHGLSLPTFLKRTSIGGLKSAMEWSWTESTFIYVENKVKHYTSPQALVAPES